MTTPTAKQVCDAAKAGDVAKLREWQLAGADINAQNEDGDVPLLLAAQGGFHEAVRWLCMAGAKKDVVDKHVGATPMLFACIEGHHKVVQELGAAGADPNAPFDSQENSITPLMFAVQYAGIQRRQGEPWNRHGAVVRVLLEGGADVSARDKSGRTALMFAAELGHSELVQWCLEFKSDPAAADVNGTTPLHYAAKGGHVDVVKALIEGGAALDAVNAKGSNAMHFAASGSSVQVCKQLHQAGLSTTVANSDGDTPLSMAIGSGSVACVGWLVDKGGASLEALDKEGRSPLDVAAFLFSANASDARQLVLDFLQRRGAKFAAIDEEFIEESHREAPKIVEKARALTEQQSQSKQ